MSFKWNEVSGKFRVWDHHSDSEKKVIKSDKQLLAKPNLTHQEDLIMALCRAVSELIEIEERRADERNTRV